MKLSKKMRKKIKTKILILLCLIVTFLAILAVNKNTNFSETIISKIKLNISTIETDGTASIYDAETSYSTSNNDSSNTNNIENINKARSNGSINAFADICVSTEGSDETGDGSRKNPYKTLQRAINEAEDQSSIYMCPGTYELEPMYIDGYAQAGIYDQGKELEIFGENDKTILIYDATSTTSRDGPAFTLKNSKTVVRNLTYVYKPKSGSNHVKAIFRWCFGKVENVFFRISGPNTASYIYNNDGGTLKVDNCTFFHDLANVDRKLFWSRIFYKYSNKCINKWNK